ncbi:MAG TPA: hypothetical protein DCZ40_00115 [Lachnospiraceae bacterium]|nr:hypothetical protein [Lachnospiraceae bacterium]
MRFSIITICKNASESIRRTMESVLQQKYDDYEYIVIDGASGDGTADIAYSYLAPKVKIISEPDKGISDAFNKGIKISAGDALFFLNSGDYFVNGDVLESVADDMAEYKADIYTYAVANIVNHKFPENEEKGKVCWEKSLIPHQGTFVRRSVFEEVGLFNENFKIRMDYDFFYRCRRAGKRFWCNPVVITYYDLNGISSADRYCFEKEGLAVRMLYDDRVDENEKEVVEFLTSEVLTKEHDREEYQEMIRSQKASIEKIHKIMEALSWWLQAVINGWNPMDYFRHRGYHRVAIYGFGKLGKILRTELLRYGMDVPYIIDRNIKGGEIDIISWEDCWKPVDCIVVTPFYAYRDIREQIRREKGDYVVVSLEDILAEYNQGLI